MLGKSIGYNVSPLLACGVFKEENSIEVLPRGTNKQGYLEKTGVHILRGKDLKSGSLTGKLKCRMCFSL